MSRRGATWSIILLALIAAGGITWWALYPKPTDEDSLRAFVAQLERRIEGKAPGRVMALVAEDYRDDYGLRRKDLSILVHRILRTAGHYEVAIAESRIETAGRRATVTLQGEATLTQGPQALARYFGRVVLVLRKDGRDWRIVSTRGWQQRLLYGAGEPLD